MQKVDVNQLRQIAKVIILSYLKDKKNLNDKMETNIDGLYACGNVTGGLLQISKAVYEGAVAGLEAVTYVKSLK